MENSNKWPTMNEFMLEAEGPNGLFAVFHYDDGAGFFFVYKPDSNEVISQICIYESIAHITVSEGDIRLMWSIEQSKCGISIFGVMRGIINIENKEVVCSQLPGREGIVDHKWLRGFEEQYFNPQDFINARQRYWQNKVN